MSNKISPIETIEMVTSNVAELRIALFELTMYFDEDEMNLFTQVHDEISKISHFIYALQIPIPQDRIKTTNEFIAIRNKIIDSSENMMKAIGIKMRSDYKNN